MKFGVFDHLELWPRQEWEKQREQLISRSEQIMAQAEQDAQQQP